MKGSDVCSPTIVLDETTEQLLIHPSTDGPSANLSEVCTTRVPYTRVTPGPRPDRSRGRVDSFGTVQVESSFRTRSGIRVRRDEIPLPVPPSSLTGLLCRVWGDGRVPFESVSGSRVSRLLVTGSLAHSHTNLGFDVGLRLLCRPDPLTPPLSSVQGRPSPSCWCRPSRHLRSRCLWTDRETQGVSGENEAVSQAPTSSFR